MLQRVRAVATRLVSSTNLTTTTPYAVRRGLSLLRQQQPSLRSGVLRSFGARYLATDSNSDKTFAGQESLPRLPIPKLDETLPKYYKSCLPLLTDEEAARTKTAVEEFGKDGGIGHKLQTRLLERDARLAADEHWLQQWWTEYAYLRWREPSAVNVNWYMVCNNHPAHSAGRPVNRQCRAAGLIYNFTQSYLKIVREEIPREYARKTPLCMDQLRRIFATARIADPECDRIETYEGSRHIVVMYHNQYFAFDVLDENYNLIAAEDILRQLLAIRKDAAPIDSVPSVGLLTAENRNTWAEARAILERNPQNKHVLDTIDRSLFMVCLDDASPSSIDDAARQFFHAGNGKNRWFDKTFSIIVCKNGVAGVNGEHTPQDAPAPARVCDIALNLETPEQYESLAAVQDDPPQVPHHKLEFNVSELDPAIFDRAKQNVARLIDSVEVTIREFNGFGAQAMKAAGASPDCFVQMVLQQAYYKLHNKVCATYETAATRQFRNGRTETVRSCSVESKAFVVSGAADLATRRQLLFKAMESQTNYMIEASAGKGVDRHLMGLRLCLTADDPVPALFTDDAYSRSSNFQLSTSNMSPGRFGRGGFAPVTDDGYGICYIIQDGRTIFNMSARGANVNLRKLGDAIDSAMNEVLLVLQHQ